MPAPLQQHIKLVGGANSVNSTIYTSSLIKIGDNVKITGCGGNDGVYTVTDVVSTLNTGEASGTTFTDNVRSANIADEATTIIMDGANTALVAGLSVSGGTIGSDVYITSVTQTSDPATFEISKELDGVLTGGTTLTFGDQDIYYVLKGKVISALTSGGDPEIRVIGQTGDKLIALGDVDSANGIDIWSNNAVSITLQKIVVGRRLKSILLLEVTMLSICICTQMVLCVLVTLIPKTKHGLSGMDIFKERNST